MHFHPNMPSGSRENDVVGAASTAHYEDVQRIRSDVVRFRSHHWALGAMPSFADGRGKSRVLSLVVVGPHSHPLRSRKLGFSSSNTARLARNHHALPLRHYALASWESIPTIFVVSLPKGEPISTASSPIG